MQWSGINTIKSYIPPSISKGKEGHTKFDKRSRETRTVNQMNSSFPNKWSFNYHNCKQQQHLFLTIFYFKITKQNKKGSIVGNCYLINNIAEDHTHTGIICNIKEPQQKYRLGTASNKHKTRLQSPIPWILLCQITSWLFLYIP